ncbi:hypothetical protein M8371_32475, partial [Klebsiella pneumoniae]|nr:hypothetical protein [Klebsiella pneumoniae]
MPFPTPFPASSRYGGFFTSRVAATLPISSLPGSSVLKYFDVIYTEPAAAITAEIKTDTTGLNNLI